MDERRERKQFSGAEGAIVVKELQRLDGNRCRTIAGTQRRQLSVDIWRPRPSSAQQTRCTSLPAINRPKR